MRTGFQDVAQIVYGPDFGSLTNKLGDPMPFRSPTTTSPGAWNPGANGIRTLSGYVAARLREGAGEPQFLGPR